MDVIILRSNMSLQLEHQLQDLLKQRNINVFIVETPDQCLIHPANIYLTGHLDYATLLIKKTLEYVFFIGDSVKSNEVIDANTNGTDFFVYEEHELDMLDSLIGLIIDNYCIEQKRYFLLQLQQDSKRIFKHTKKYLDDIRKLIDLDSDIETNDELKEFLVLYLDLWALKDRLLFHIEYKDYLKCLKQGVGSFGFVNRISIVRQDELTWEEGWESLYNTDLFLPIYNVNTQLFLKISIDKTYLDMTKKSDHYSLNIPKAAFVIWSVYCVVLEYFHRDFKKKEIGNKNIFFEDVFSAMTFPVAFFSKDGTLLFHNSKFVSLSVLPKDCLNLVSGQKYENQGLIYHVECIEVEDQYQYLCYAFLHNSDLKEDMSNLSSSELGIISSSIAHELNNPLAGMLAAVDVLMLEEGSTDYLNSLKEMKETIQRCQILVRIFLGFSKKEPSLGHIEKGISDSFSQALGLMRFRMIESNIRYEIVLITENGPFSNALNQSVIAIVFYLILGEVMTLYSHLDLVNQKKNTGTVIISGKMMEEKNAISLVFDNAIEGLDSLLSSRLLSYLLDFEKLSMGIHDQKRIVLREKKLSYR